jgi:CheY-like chemotaxis protein
MAKVLLVDPDPDRLATLQTVLAEAGHQIAVAPSGSFALTMLEWDRQDAIVSRAETADMSGCELCSILKIDPATKAIPFLLLAPSHESVASAAARAGVDLVLAGDFIAATVLSRVETLLVAAPPPPVPSAPRSPVGSERYASPPRANGARPATAPPAPDRARGAPPARTLQGSLGVLDLAEVAQAIALGGKTGLLALSLADGEGMVIFDGGRAVHAEFGGRRGEAAFAALIAASRREVGGTFCFDPVDRHDLPSAPRTIDRSVEKLLINIAVELDEGAAGAGAGVPAPRPTHREDG